jgi:hypothetical protein
MSNAISILETISVPTMQVSLRSDGIIQIVVDPGTRVILENVKLQIAAIGKIGGGKKYPILIISGKDTSMETDVMSFTAQAGSNPYALAEAYLITSITHKLLANFYLNINKPARPTRTFTAEEEALKWLNTFRSE